MSSDIKVVTQSAEGASAQYLPLDAVSDNLKCRMFSAALRVLDLYINGQIEAKEGDPDANDAMEHLDTLSCLAWAEFGRAADPAYDAALGEVYSRYSPLLEELERQLQAAQGMVDRSIVYARIARVQSWRCEDIGQLGNT